ncbi:SF1B family DNA helicase RecD2 [Arboricoccus pini]|uniref:SF1B family DNA helicase RecD2 n=1 Tax=Arboricoccus pini TaxID=1963835 RepID=UPI001FAFB7CF|nr:ATP-dependent RecD-like DNA helicase [Arboricoccus pini]
MTELVEGQESAREQQGTFLTGTVEKVAFRNAETGYTVLRLRTAIMPDLQTLVGRLQPLRPGDLVRATGTWKDDKAWGRQFEASEADIVASDVNAGIEAYLASGVVPGIGEELAKRVALHFGEKLADVLATRPERLQEVQGIGATLATRIADAWQREDKQRNLMVFFHGNGLGPAKARAIIEAYGEEAIAKVSDDPYALARDVRGFGFSSADDVARRLGIAPDASVRLVAALEEAMRQAADAGHTAVPKAILLADAAQLLALPRDAIEPAFESAIRLGLLRAEGENGQQIQLAALADAEDTIARRLGAIGSSPSAWAARLDPTGALAAADRSLGVELAPTQREAVKVALSAKITIITGGPGTGKTTLVRAILAAIDSLAARAGESTVRVALAAPTGRAAKRLTESTGVEAKTLHRLLEADPGRGFRRHAGRPLEVDLLVCDEMSMVDTNLMAALLDALPDDAALLLVGDADQLPSVGPGQVLDDLIRSGRVPTIRLTEIFRQASQSAIVTNAHAINEGRLPRFLHRDDELGDFYGIRADTPEAVRERLVELVAKRIPQRFGLDPWTDVQVLSPMNRGPLGTQALNAVLRQCLNPEPIATVERGDIVFAVGDKVMQIENDYDREVYNGDLGRVTAIDRQARTLRAIIDSRELLYTFSDLSALAPAYAVTIHKAQGSEYPAVVLALGRQHGRMLRRRLLYTAITRARRLVVIVGDYQALERAVHDVGENGRRTLLIDKFKQKDPV